MQRAILFAIAALGGAAVAGPANAAVSLKLFTAGLSNPLFVTGRANSVYVVEQGGRIVKIDRSTRVQSVFATIPGIETGGEKGLLGFAFDPLYKANGRFYVNVTARVGGQLVTEIRRYTDPSIAVEAAQVVLRFDQPFDNHNGGWIGFGRDKKLYVATGDGGSGNDPQNNAQNKNVLLGKLLRIDITKDGYPADPNRNYTIPADNPFGTEVFAYGLRNPFRDSFDAATGDLYIGDVGQGRFEEVDRIAYGTSGQNFGWRPLEGTLPTPGVGDPVPPGTTDPLFGYTHADGQSITGGYVYRGRTASELAGRYVFGDFVAGRLWSIALDGSGLSEFTSAVSPFGTINPSSFGEDGNLGLYVVDYGGRVFSIQGSKSLAPGNARSAAAVPEPASWALMIGGFAIVGAAMRRRRLAAWEA